MPPSLDAKAAAKAAAAGVKVVADAALHGSESRMSMDAESVASCSLPEVGLEVLAGWSVLACMCLLEGSDWLLCNCRSQAAQQLASIQSQAT